MRRGIAGLALVAALVVASGGLVARAEAPNTRLAMIGGFGMNLGDLGDRYTLGGSLGIEAGYQLNGGAIGLAWRLSFARYWSSDEAQNVEDLLGVTQMGLGIRPRFALPAKRPMFVVTELSMELIRMSVPVPPDEAQNYYGPAFGVGLELPAGSVIFSVLARYGVFGDGPSALTMVVAIGFGEE